MRELSEAEVLQQIEAFYNYVEKDEEEVGVSPSVVPSSEDHGQDTVPDCTQFPGFPVNLPGWLREEACDD